MFIFIIYLFIYFLTADCSMRIIKLGSRIQIRRCIILKITIIVKKKTKYIYLLSGPAPACRARVDLCLVIDSTGTFRDTNPADNLLLELEFFADLVSDFPIEPDDTSVAAVVFSGQAELAFPLNEYGALHEVQEAILGITHLGPRTPNTPEALRVVGTECFNAANGDRDDADNVIIIATDGSPYPPFRRNSALTEARRLKDKGVTIAAVGITTDVDENFLRGISSGNNYFAVREFTELQGVKEPLLDQLCLSLEEGEFVNFVDLVSSLACAS